MRITAWSLENLKFAQPALIRYLLYQKRRAIGLGTGAMRVKSTSFGTDTAQESVQVRTHMVITNGKESEE